MKELIEYIAKALVDEPEAVEVTVVEDERVIELSVAVDDRGKVIGRKGRTAHAIRTLLQAAAKGESEPYTFEIVD